MSKRKSLISMAAMFLALSLILVFSRPVKAAAGVSLKANRTYNAYDITGDKIKDTIRISTVADKTESGIYRQLYISVNGKTAYQLANTRFFYINAVIYKLGNGQPILYLRTEEENDDGPVCVLLKYSNGKFQKALDLKTIMKGYGSHINGEVTKINGNQIVITESIVSWSLGVNTINFIYKYSNGKFVQASKYGTYKAIYAGGKKTEYLTTSRKLSTYSKLGASKASGSIKAGTRVKIKRCALVNGKMYIQLEKSGKTYWIRPLTTPAYSDALKQFMDVTYAG